MKRLLFLMTIVAVLGIGKTAQAGVVIDFSTGLGGAGGSISIGANITGSGIFIDAVTIVGAPVNNGVFDVDGAGVCLDGAGGCGLLSFDKNLNSILIVGSIPDLGIGLQNLLVGDLAGGLIAVFDNGIGGSVFGSGNDQKSRELLLALGLDPNTPFSFFGFSFGFGAGQVGGPYTAISTDITNTQVPEPASLLLLGTGFVGLASRVRRRLRNKA